MNQDTPKIIAEGLRHIIGDRFGKYHAFVGTKIYIVTGMPNDPKRFAITVTAVDDSEDHPDQRHMDQAVLVDAARQVLEAYEPTHAPLIGYLRRAYDRVRP